MAKLSQVQFTALNDNASSSSGWTVLQSEVINSLAGNDIITGTYSPLSNIWQGILNRGSIFTGDGIDKIIGIGETGIFNDGLIDLGSGADSILARTSPGGLGIENRGFILTGDGNDVVTAGLGGNQCGLFNAGWAPGMFTANAFIYLGLGNDIITAKANPSRGPGGGVAIENYGTIDTGDGNDKIIASAGFKAIRNFGSISTGNGDDVVDALLGGFGGNGFIDLGPGNDSLKGFGSGTFLGGSGIDTLTFPTGVYSVAGTSNPGGYVIGGVMNIIDYEAFGLGSNVQSIQTAAALGSVIFI